MKGNNLFIAHDYRELYISSCDSLKRSIINALGEILLLTGLEMFSLDRNDAVKVGKNEFVGVCIKDKCLHFVVNNGKKVDYIKIFDKQKSKVFKEFDSDIQNWISFIEKIQNEFNNAIK
jgi:hypothetical protein